MGTTRPVSEPSGQRLLSIFRGFSGVQSRPPSGRTHNTLVFDDRLLKNGSQCGNGGQMVNFKDEEEPRDRRLPGSSSQVNLRSCPVNNLPRRQGFSSLAPILVLLALLWGCSVHGRMFSSIPGLHPLDASRKPSLPNKNCHQTSPSLFWGARSLPLENRLCQGSMVK